MADGVGDREEGLHISFRTTIRFGDDKAIANRIPGDCQMDYILARLMLMTSLVAD